jgi:hypothetical protein
MTRIEGRFADWLAGVARQARSCALLLLQGYPYTGFAAFDETGKVTLPAEFPQPDEDKWKLYWDIRIFDRETEWHAWRAGSGVWFFRAANWRHWPSHDEAAYQRDYAIWGTQRRVTDGWRCFSEDRGAAVWIPGSAGDFQEFPRLRVRLRPDYEDDTGIAGIVDAMIVGFTVSGAE